MTRYFAMCATDDSGSFTSWVWYLQIVINIAPLAGALRHVQEQY